MSAELWSDEKIAAVLVELKSSLAKFLDREMFEAGINKLLLELSQQLNDTQKGYSGLDIGLYRAAFEELTKIMDAVAAEKFEAPRKKWRKPQESRPYVRMLDDKYWGREFQQQYAEGLADAQKRGEAEEYYRTRYMYQSMQGLLFTPFAHMQPLRTDPEHSPPQARRRFGRSIVQRVRSKT